MENLKSLKGAKVLNKAEQQLINGGKTSVCDYFTPCPPRYYCQRGRCIPDIFP